MKFEWDEKKNIDNKAKHNVSFDEAQLAFLDNYRLIINDSSHSIIENRMLCLGKVDGRILTVRFTVRDMSIRNYWCWLLAERSKII